MKRYHLHCPLGLKSFLGLLLFWITLLPPSTVAQLAKPASLPAGLLTIAYPKTDTAATKKAVSSNFFQMLWLYNAKGTPLRLVQLSAGKAINTNTGENAAVQMALSGTPVSDTINLVGEAPMAVSLQCSLPKQGNWLIVLQAKILGATRDTLGQLFFQLPIFRGPDVAIPETGPSFVIEDLATINSGANPTLRLLIRDTSHTEQTIDLPQLILNRKGEGGALFQAKYDLIHFTTEKGVDVEHIVLKANEKQAILATFQGLRSAGTYEGSLIINSPNSTDIVKPFSLNVRSSALWAIFLISAGVFGGFMIVMLMTKTKPRLEMAQRVEHLRADIQSLAQQLGPLEPNEQSVLEQISAKVDAKAQQLRYQIPANLAADLSVVHTKLDLFMLWVKMGRLVRDAQPNAAGADAVKAALQNAQNYLNEPNAAVADAAAITQALNGIPQLLGTTALAASDGNGAPEENGTFGARKIPSFDEISRYLLLTEVSITAIIMLLSTLVGLLTLYVPNATWGTTSDKILAFLWGFGLHTIAKNTDFGSGVFSFISGKFTGAAPAPAVQDPPAAA